MKISNEVFCANYITDPLDLQSILDEVKLDAEAYLYLDTETKGLYGQIRLVQLYQSHWTVTDNDGNDKPRIILIDAAYIPLAHIFRKIRHLHIVGHNVFYDVRGFYDELGATFREWSCTQLALRLCNPELEEFNLNEAIKKVCNINIYKAFNIDKKVEQKGDWSKDLSEQQLTYAALDVLYLPSIVKHCLARKAFDHYSYKLDVRTCKYMMVFQRTGLPVSQEKLLSKEAQIQENIAELSKELPDGFNCNSYRQVRALLGIDPNGESDDYVLADFEAAHPMEQTRKYASIIRQVKKQRKLLSFIEKFKSERIYGRFGVAARSGRSNCQDQNLQQIPSKLKDVIHTDKFFVYADFSNLELRTFAAMVGEEVMARKLRNNEDLHTFVASKIFNGLKVNLSDKEKRQVAKIFNFSSLYGAGVTTRLNILLKNTGIKLREEDGKEVARSWNNVFPGVRTWQEENARKYNNGELGYTALGRPYKAKMFTDQNNIMIQGSGAEVAKLAMHFCAEKGLKLEKLCVFIHDSYTYECETLEEAKHYAEVLAKSMQQAWKVVSQHFLIKDLPMPVEAVVAHNWKDCQENENILFTFSLD